MPSLGALQLDDERRLADEARRTRLRSQVAVVRAIADQVEHLSRTGDADGLAEQLVEEMARLGRRILEAAQSQAGSARITDSGIFTRSASPGSAG